MRHSTSLTVFLSLSLLACSGSSTDETTDSGAVDTSADTASEDVVVVRNFSVTNCNTGAAVEGFEICDSPTVSGVETCGTTDANGQTSTTWVNPPLASDVWIKGTHPEYSTGIATGFYDEDGYNATLELIESGGSVQGNLCFFNKATSSTFLAGGELVAEEGMGQVWFVLYSNDNDDVSGATVEFYNADGELVEQAMYQAGMTGDLKPDATETSGRGGVLGYNLTPGDYTVKITHETLDCVSDGWAYKEAEANAIPVPVQADTWTYTYVDCSPR